MSDQYQTIDSQIEWIKRHNNVPALDAIRSTLEAYKKLRAKVEQLPDDLLSIDPDRYTVSMKLIMDSVADVYQIEPIYLRNKTRMMPFIEARQVACFFMRKYGYSTVEIGRRVRRDHSTVIHSTKMVKNLMSVDEKLRHRMLQIEERIEEKIRPEDDYEKQATRNPQPILS